MFSKMKNLYQDFLQLPMGFRVVSVVVTGAGFVGLIWAFSLGGMVLPILGIIAALVVLFYLVGILARFIAKRRGKGMGASLWALTDRKKDDGDEYATRAEADAARKLRQRWKDVYQLLTEKGYDFYSLPWYLVIGPSQSGKTTLIQKSNQEFPIGDKPVSDFGTKNCNWFFTNKAILIDTAGRYLEHLGQEDESPEGAEDKAEWEEFLSLLMRYRKRSPINGLILVVKIPDVLSPDPIQQERTAEMLRKALLDIEDRLKIQCPVYVMVSMCDLLTGFNEFFSLLPGLSDRSLLGWSRAEKYDTRFEGDEVGRGLDKVTDLLRDLRLDFMNEKASLAANDPGEMKQIDKLYAFPDEFQAMLDPLRTILKKAFDQSTYYQGHFLRGVFFTSALQKGEPVLGACLNLLGRSAEALSATDETLAGTSKAFFIADFFEEKVFAEKGLVKPTARSSREKRLKETAAFTAGALLLLGTLGWAAVKGFSLNKTVASAGTALTDVQAELEKRKSEPDAPSERLPVMLKDLHTDLSQLDEATAWISAGEVDETIRKGDYTIAQSYIYHCFRPALARFLDSGTTAETWEEGVRSFETLAALHRLSLGGADGSASSPWTDDLERAALAIGCASAGSPDTAGLFPIEPTLMEANDETRAYIAGILGDELCRNRIWQRLREGILDPWDGMLEQLRNEPHDARRFWPDANLDNPLARAWTLDRLHCIEEQFGVALGDLRQVLGRIKLGDNWKDDESYRTKIVEPWKKQATRLRELLAAAERMTRSGVFFVDPEEALAARRRQFEDLKTELRIDSAPAELAGEAWSRTSRPLVQLEATIVRRNGTIREWLGKTDPGRHPLFAITDGAAAGGATGKEGAATRPGKQVEMKDLRTIHEELAGIERLVLYDIATAANMAPDNPEFWSLPLALDTWLNTRLAFLTGIGAAGSGGEPAGGATASLLDREIAAGLVAGFGNRLLLSFFGRVKVICTAERDLLFDALGLIRPRQSRGKIGAKGPQTTFFSDEGYRFSPEAVVTINNWGQSVYNHYEPDPDATEALPGEWRQYFGDFDFLNATGSAFNDAFGIWWTERVSDSLADYLRCDAAADAATGRDALTLLASWPKGRSNREFGIGLKRLLETLGDLAGENEWGRETWIDADLPYRDGYLLWERYADDETRRLLEKAATDFLEARDALAERNAKLGDSGELDPRFSLLSFALEKKAGLMAFHILKKQLDAGTEGVRLEADPVLDTLAAHADRIRDALTRIGEELFEDNWALVADHAGDVTGTFPFHGDELPLGPDGKALLASWVKATEFLRSHPFQDLADTVGNVFTEDDALFSITITPPEKRDCFRRCVQLSRFLLKSPEITARVEGIGAWRVKSSRWAFMVVRGSKEEANTGFSAAALDPFEVALDLGSETRRIFLRERKRGGGDEEQGEWDSFHPFPPGLQVDSPWNILAWFWQWGSYDAGEGVFDVTVRFPGQEKRGDVKNRTFELDRWLERLKEEDVRTMELKIRMPDRFPDRAPDLRDAGWGVD